MKTETCEKTMDEFMMLDKNERIPLKLTMHLLRCKKCRTQVRYLMLAEKYAVEPMHGQSMMKKIENMEIKPVSMTKWIVSGIIMISALMIFGLFLNKIDRTSFSIIFYVIFGIIVTAYSSIFVASNIDFFVKKAGK